MYEILNEGNAPFLYDTVNDYVREHDHNTRNHNQFLLPYPGICNVKINFLYLAIGYWHNLENIFKEAGSFNVLKTMLSNNILAFIRIVGTLVFITSARCVVNS